MKANASGVKVAGKVKAMLKSRTKGKRVSRTLKGVKPPTVPTDKHGVKSNLPVIS